MKVSTLLLRLDELEYSRQGIVYCTLMDYLGLPFNKGKSLYDHKSGKIKTIRYYRKRRNYIDHHDYMYAALAYLRIQGVAVKDEASRKHPRLGKGIIIKTRFIMDIPMQMFNSNAQYRYYLSKLKMASEPDDAVRHSHPDVRGQAALYSFGLDIKRRCRTTMFRHHEK